MNEKSRLVRAKELADLVPYSQQHIRRLEAAGEFPKRVQVGEGRIAWVRSEVEEWLDKKMAER